MKNFNKITKVVVVIDAFSTGKYLPQAILNRGYSWIHVISRDNLPTYLTSGIEHKSCLETLYYQNNFKLLIQSLKKYEIVAVIAGAETSIELTEQLSSVLKLAGNNPETSSLRRNKYHMVEAVNKAGLKTAKQCYSNNLEKIIHWYNSQFKLGDTIVVKPVNSAGTDQVTFCSSVQEIENAVNGILGKRNKLGLLNSYVLAQSFLKGHEYVVNTVSLQGKHYFTDIWQCYKYRVPGAGFVPGCEVLRPYDGEIQDKLRDYVIKALDALQIVQGPAHFEIMLTDEGPKIIEVGARIQGGVNPEVHIECMGTSQLEKTVDCYLEPMKFQSFFNHGYSLKKYSRWIDLIVPCSGTINSFNLIEKVKKLPSFYCATADILPGDFLHKTIDLYTSPGNIYLVHEDPEQLEKDYHKLRALEKESYAFIEQ